MAVSARPGLLRKRPRYSLVLRGLEHPISDEVVPGRSSLGRYSLQAKAGGCAVMPNCHTAPFDLVFESELAIPQFWIFGQPREGNGPCGRATICSARHLR